MAPQSRLEMLDQLFAEHFGAAPLAKSNDLAATSRWVNSQSSDSDTTGPLTPASVIRDIDDSPKGAMNSLAPNNGNDHALKLHNLYSSLAELYAKDAPSASVSEASNGALGAEGLEGTHAPRPGGSQPSRSPKASSPKQGTLTAESGSATDSRKSSGIPSRRAALADAAATEPMLKMAQETALTQQANGEAEGEEDDIIDDLPVRNRLRSMMPRHSIIETHGAGFMSKNLSVQPMTALKTIGYEASTLPLKYEGDADLRDLLSKTFPQLCEAPHALMVDDEGHELPPLKYEETSELERKARKEALVIKIQGTKKHTLLKSFVVLESRGVSWKRTGAVDLPSLPASQRNRASRQALSALDPLPNPWDIEIYHEDSETRNIKGSARRIFELPQSRRCGLCPKCEGNGKEPCGICKGNEPDECFWCSGTGRDVHRLQRCTPCNGSGKLQCKACNGRLQNKCKACSGEGTGMFCVLVQIKVRRVDFAPVPLLPILREARVSEQDEASVKAAVLKRTWDAINKLTEASGVKHKHVFRPLSAACSCDTSESQLLEVDVPGAGRFRKAHAGHAVPGPTAHKDERKKTTKRYTKRYFVVPSDSTLQPVEMSEEDFELSLQARVKLTQASAQLLSQGVRSSETPIYGRSSTDSSRTTGGASSGRHTPGRIAFAAAATPPLMTPALSSLLHPVQSTPLATDALSTSLPRSESRLHRGVVKKLAAPLIRAHSRSGKDARKPVPTASLPSSPLVATDGGMDSYFGSAGAMAALPLAESAQAGDDHSDMSDAQVPLRRSMSLRAMRHGNTTTTAGKYQAHARIAAPARSLVDTDSGSTSEHSNEHDSPRQPSRSRHSARSSTASAVSARSTLSSEPDVEGEMAIPTAAQKQRLTRKEGNYI